MSLESWIKVLTLFGGVVSFMGTFSWGVLQHIQNERRQLESRRIEATKPFLERQLKLYTEVSEIAAVLATSDDQNQWETSAKRFRSLYWGELALVEDYKVEEAMVALNEALKKKSKQEDLQSLSLLLARACRDSLAISWGVKEWRTPAP